MRWTTTLLLLTVTVGIGAYISLYEIRQPSREQREQLAKHVVDIDPEAVTQLTLDLPKVRATLTRSGEAWRLAPHHARADGELVDRILSSLAPLTADRTLRGSPDRPLDPKTFGLDPPEGSLTFIADQVSTTVLIGQPTPVQANRYLTVSSRPEIFIVSSQLFETADQPPDTFRDPLLLRFDTSLADRLAVTTRSTAFSLTRIDEDWQLEQPVSDRADRSAVTAVLSGLAGIRIKRFVEEAPQAEQLAAWGLDQPTSEVLLVQRGEPSSSVTVFFGGPLPDDSTLIYAKRSDEASLYAVAADDVESLLNEPQRLRQTACFDFFTSQAGKIELASGQTSWTIERTELTSPQVGTHWRQSGSETPLDPQRVDEYLQRLAELRLVGFVDETPANLAGYGLDTPAGTISLWVQGQDQPQRLILGGVVGGSADRYARIEGRRAVVRLPGAVTDLLTATVDRFQAPPPQAPAQGSAPPAPAPTVTP